MIEQARVWAVRVSRLATDASTLRYCLFGFFCCNVLLFLRCLPKYTRLMFLCFEIRG